VSYELNSKKEICGAKDFFDTCMCLLLFNFNFLTVKDEFNNTPSIIDGVSYRCGRFDYTHI